MVELNIDMIEDILTHLQNNEFSNLTSWNICKARKGMQYIHKHLPELKSIPFIVDFFHEHIKKKEWMKETEIINNVKLKHLEDAKKEIEICKASLNELKEVWLVPRVNSCSSFRSLTENINHVPSTLGLIKTIVEEEETKDRQFSNMARSPSPLYVDDGNDETLASLRKQIEERNQTFKEVEEKLQNFENIFTKFGDGQHVVKSGFNQGIGEMDKLTEVEKLKENNADLLNRLSHIASEKLRNGNPNITDLGDPNRPTKLGEQFSELYDNEWTDAFEELSNTVHSEKEIIKTLLEIVMTAFHFCAKSAEKQFENLRKALMKEMLFASDFQNGEGTNDGQNAVFDEVMLSLSELRQRCAIVSLPKLKQMIAEHEGGKLEPRVEQGSKLMLYTNRCVELTWRMCIQSPPMYLHTCEAGLPCEGNFRSYTRSGTVIEYCVWPCVYLSKGGHVMIKGVAQMTDPPEGEK